MRPLRYSINVTLDGCVDHRVMLADEELQELHRHAVENLNQADALLFGRVTYEMMEAAWRPPARTGARPDWMEPFARTIDAAKKYVVPVPRARGERVGSGRGNFYQKLVSPIQVRRGSFAELRRFAAKNFQAVENDRETLRGECRKSFFSKTPFFRHADKIEIEFSVVRCL